MSHDGLLRALGMVWWRRRIRDKVIEPFSVAGIGSCSPAAFVELGSGGSLARELSTSQSSSQLLNTVCHPPQRCPTSPVLEPLASHQYGGVSVDWMWGLQQCAARGR